MLESCTAKAVEEGGGKGDWVGGFLHGRRDVGGGTEGTGRREMHGAGATASVELGSGHGGEGGGG